GRTADRRRGGGPAAYPPRSRSAARAGGGGSGRSAYPTKWNPPVAPCSRPGLDFGDDSPVVAHIGDDPRRVIRGETGGEQGAQVAHSKLGPEPGGDREAAQAFEALVRERPGASDPEQLAEQPVEEGIGVGAARPLG